MADRINLRLIKGDDWDFDYAFEDESGSAIDITGYTLYLYIKNSLDDADSAAIVSEEVTSFDDAANGTHQINVPDTTTKDIDQKIIYYSTAYKGTDGKYHTIAYGHIVVDDDAMKDPS